MLKASLLAIDRSKDIFAMSESARESTFGTRSLYENVVSSVVIETSEVVQYQRIIKEQARDSNPQWKQNLTMPDL
jgi:hypothetical protein